MYSLVVKILKVFIAYDRNIIQWACNTAEYSYLWVKFPIDIKQLETLPFSFR